ncbi:peptide chain release factor 1 [Candidatus Hydrogenosomobacter endosymbioticus]|uniref:Peptide chain release factor 1 n=1 Tax=Candidatus Hydrogenosomobacter endosymbioticus TaxID=2558174 RepID=A0ABM7V921_9PROT|nr:peptide chain release factor 1 [Candidatus Hydrogenosomobacter endosymbioticus]BDB96292.1 peptide chain release factor 1 [Candidatus Hydrogenosomobacter endosymbioticus]
MSFAEKLEKIAEKFRELEKCIEEHGAADQQVFVQASKEHSRLAPLMVLISEFHGLQGELEDLRVLACDEDENIRLMAEADIKRIESELPKKENEIKIMLLPEDEDDSKDVIVEVRAGTGGEEAALFAGDLLRMYSKYAVYKGWSSELLGVSDSSYGGVKEASVSISGKNVFANLKFEAGVHRVQRVPETEASGRIHTSAATVAVLPQAEEIDVQIDERDLRIDVFRSSGPGGQSVNTTDSAVRVTHIPTGIVVQQQDEKSQHKNKSKALKILRARLYDQKRAESEKERSASRKSQIGSGDRSERIRTYNFPQSRVTDHRINLTLYKLGKVLDGEALDEIVSALKANDIAEKLSEDLL